MERLTGRTELGSLFQKGEVSTRQMIDKLGMYEDLEEKLQSAYGECDGLLETAINHLVEHPEVSFETPTKAVLLTDEDADKWKHWKELDANERLIELPCKIGDTVWYIGTECDTETCPIYDDYCYRGCEKLTTPKVKSDIIQRFIIHGNKSDSMCGYCQFYLIGVGKTVFLTKEEAEQAFKQMYGE